MKLILTLSLICTLTSTVGALQCLDNRGNQQICLTDEVCATISVGSNDGKIIMRTCLPSTLCLKQNELMSARFGLFGGQFYLQCCHTDGCNNHAGYDSFQQEKENGLECFSCAGSLDMSCNTTVKCVGIQNRCAAVTLHREHEIAKSHGCASANVCETLSNFKIKHPNSLGMKKFSVEKCCDSSFCNSAWTVKSPDQGKGADWTVKRPDQVTGAAWTVKMHFGALLLSLIALVVY